MIPAGQMLTSVRRILLGVRGGGDVPKLDSGGSVRVVAYTVRDGVCLVDCSDDLAVDEER